MAEEATETGLPEAHNGLVLRYFDEIVPIERVAIDKRRGAIRERRKHFYRNPIGKPRDLPGDRPDPAREKLEVPRFPYPGDVGPKSLNDVRLGGADEPDAKRTRPRPEPRDLTGLALSGGGIRSAAVCLGALQALDLHEAIDGIDYLSTVSGGGYVGASMTVATSAPPRREDPAGMPGFPFECRNDPRDTAAVGHIRNYSNYLMPRATSGVRNASEAIVVFLRGILANAVLVSIVLLALALLTNRAYPDTASLQCGSFIPNLFRVGSCTDLHTFWLTLAALLTLLYVLLLWVLSRSARARQDHNGRLRGGVVTAVLVSAVLLGFTLLTDVARPDGDADRCGGFVARFFGFKHCVEIHPFWLAPGTFLAFGYLPLVWILWRMARAGRSPGVDNDVGSPLLKAATWVFWACIAFAILDVQPRLIAALDQLYARPPTATISAGSLKGVLAGATAFISAVAAFSGKIGQFLKVSEHATRRSVLVARVASQALVWLAAVLLPLLLFVLYLHLAAWGMDDLQGAKRPFDSIPQIYPWALAATVLVGVFFKPNSYSLHQLYRDRLSKAFLFDPRDPDGRPADAFKLSQIDVLQGPYHLINAAMNVQGSLAANQRGREADFFTFSRDFVGSDLTLYARTNSRAAVPAAAGHRGAGPSAEPRPWVRRLADAVRHVFHGFFERKGRYADMEGADPALSVATAMAISGAAFSANMGSNTVRPLSPTLALLNVRLGYWLRNPRELAKPRQITVRRLIDAAHLVFGKLYLLLEMLNMLDEKSRNIYLSDGGHIENLGVYELLKRGCQLIIAVDAECDPALAFPSLVKMERYARIDLGVRIDLPWEEITAASRRYDRELADGTLSCPWNNGPHCAFGHILYHDGSEGVLFYVKSAVTGDETDYVLDYKRRYPAFPHETTGDQFFSEEQFEAYRALGFHAVDRALAGSDQIALSDELRARGITPEMMLDWVRGMLCCI